MGTVKIAIYWFYLEATGYVLVALIAISLTLMQITKVIFLFKTEKN